MHRRAMNEYISYGKLRIIRFFIELMMIAPHSRAHKGEKEKGEVKGNMEEIEGRRSGMLITGEWCNPVSNMLHHV